MAGVSGARVVVGGVWEVARGLGCGDGGSGQGGIPRTRLRADPLTLGASARTVAGPRVREESEDWRAYLQL